MGTQVNRLESDRKKAISEISKLVAGMKKGTKPDPKVIGRIQKLMTEYSDTNFKKMHAAAAAYDAEAAIKADKMMAELNKTFM